MIIWILSCLVSDVLHSGNEDANDLYLRIKSVYSGNRQTSAYEGIETIIKAIEKTKQRLDANVNFDLALELLMLTIKEN